MCTGVGKGWLGGGIPLWRSPDPSPEHKKLDNPGPLWNFLIIGIPRKKFCLLSSQDANIFFFFCYNIRWKSFTRSETFFIWPLFSTFQTPSAPVSKFFLNAHPWRPKKVYPSDQKRFWYCFPKFLRALLSQFNCLYISFFIFMSLLELLKMIFLGLFDYFTLIWLDTDIPLLLFFTILHVCHFLAHFHHFQLNLT